VLFGVHGYGYGGVQIPFAFLLAAMVIQGCLGGIKKGWMTKSTLCYLCYACRRGKDGRIFASNEKVMQIKETIQSFTYPDPIPETRAISSPVSRTVDAQPHPNPDRHTPFSSQNPRNSHHAQPGQ
jgi:hypothetical protein